MNILSIGTIDNKGGAAQISWELRRRLKADGHKVTTFVRYKYSDEPDVFAIPRKRYQDWLVKLFANDLTFAGRSGSDFIFDSKEYQEADLIHCHNLHSNFFNLRDLIRMSSEKPVVWTLHDMWAFTGFANNSATLRHPNKKKFLLYLWDNTSFLLKKKERIYRKSAFSVVAVSDWLKKEAEKSILQGQSIMRIHNGIDIDTFTPLEKNATGNGRKKEAARELARETFGLPAGKKIVGFGIKGWTDVGAIIDSYQGRDDVFFVSIGHDLTRTTNKNFKALPRTEDRKTLATYLRALDVFLHLTEADAFGLISTEALACGTPVVAYAIDAQPEIVAHKEVGYLAAYENVEDAKKGMEYIVNLPAEASVRMQTAARQRVEKLFSAERMYREYLALYQKLISKKPILSSNPPSRQAPRRKG